METFSFSIPQNVIFGKGSLGKLPEAAKALGKNKALIISGPHLNRIGMADKCRAALSAVERHEVTPELEDVVEATIYLSGLGFENVGLAAAHAIAGLVPDEELSEDNILPEAFDPRVADVVSRAVKELI